MVLLSAKRELREAVPTRCSLHGRSSHGRSRKAPASCIERPTAPLATATTRGIVRKSLTTSGGYDGFGWCARGQSETSVVQRLRTNCRTGGARDTGLFPDRSGGDAGADRHLSSAVQQALPVARARGEYESLERALGAAAQPASSWPACVCGLPSDRSPDGPAWKIPESVRCWRCRRHSLDRGRVWENRDIPGGDASLPPEVQKRLTRRRGRLIG
jgi:hypothetical protein